MQRTTITVLGHTVECNNHTGDTIDMQQLEEQIQLGDKEGNLYWDGYIVPIGTWKIVNPEAEKWKSIADKLYHAWVYLRNDALKEAIQEYKQLIEDEKSK